MHVRFAPIAQVADAELRTSRRLVRFWSAAVVLSIISIFGYVLSCLILSFTAPYSPSLGAATPLYLLGGIDPTFFLAYQIAALLLLFDVGHRNVRNRIEEVLDSRPIANIEYLIGRVLGSAILLWIVVALNILAMQCAGVLANAFGFYYAEPIQWHSIINLLLIDTPVTLVFWSSLVVFLSVVLRFRLLIVAVAIGLMFAWFFLFLNVPYSLLSVVSASSNDSLFVSDLVPDFASWQTITVRVSTLLGALALVAGATIAMRRRDGVRMLASVATVVGAVALCGGTYVLSASNVMHEFGKTAKWKEAHSVHNWTGSIDVKEIYGTVSIDPGRLLDIDLSLVVTVDADSARHLTFTFNPAMTIDEIELDGQPTSHTFQDGLLELKPLEPLDIESQHVLRMKAHGIPDPRFAYFDSTEDYATDRGVPTRSVRILGRDGSVFRSNFVALMPGVYWYPVPGPVWEDFASAEEGHDFFDVDLSINLLNDNLRLVGSGATVSMDEGDLAYRMTSETPLHSIGLFAAHYESASIEVDGTTFSMHLHRRHAKNLSLAAGIEEQLAEEVRTFLQQFDDSGLTVPNKGIAFVEVPNRLRIVGGGWRMDSASALPGIALMKAQAFPRTNFDLALRFARLEEDTEFSALQVRHYLQFFEMGLGVDNLWTTIPTHLWSQVTSARGDHAEALDQIALSLISNYTKTPEQFFSIYATFHIAHTTAVSPGTLDYGADPDGWTPVGFDVRDSEVNFGKRPSLWTYMESHGFSNLPSPDDPQKDLELMLLKSNAIAQALFYANGRKETLEWLADMRRRFAGQNYTYNDLVEVAREHEIIYDPFLTDWLHESTLPAYAVKLISIERIADDQQENPRYQTTVEVRNVAATTGFIGVQSAQEGFAESIAVGFLKDQARVLLEGSQGIRMEGNSAKRINVVESDPSSRVIVSPYLSLNRKLVTLSSDVDSIPTYPNKAPSPFEETSDWMPRPQGIVVDDLDSGFTISQTVPNIRQSSNLGPFDWFREHQTTIDLEHGLPSWQDDIDMMHWWGPTRTLWNRVSLPSAYGEFRRTSTNFMNRRDVPTLPTARFETSVPDSGLWTLEYHIPWFPIHFRNELKYQFLITNGDNDRDVEFVVDKSHSSFWKLVGSYELSAGPVAVEIIGAEGFGILFADAIRWNKADGT